MPIRFVWRLNIRWAGSSETLKKIKAAQPANASQLRTEYRSVMGIFTGLIASRLAPTVQND
jgi:hypothetical protein